MADKEIRSIEDMPDNCLVGEVAEYLRQSEDSIRRMVRGGKFPNAYRHGRVNIIPKEDVIAFVKGEYGNLGHKGENQ